jgi:NAD(P)-dependent dehydrogenase (short-subunit alcohol dehydrogenase family)
MSSGTRKTSFPGAGIGRREICAARPDHWIDRRFHGRHYPAVYNGIKAFLDSFSFALRHRWKDTGVSATCLTPEAFETDSLKSAKQKERSGGSH